MRNTEQKRQHILDTAYRLFRSKGFENTSMSEITAEARGSKAPIYNYFPSKEELIVEYMANITDHHLEGLLAGLQNPKGGVASALHNFGGSMEIGVRMDLRRVLEVRRRAYARFDA
jgi:AcrR family transcriptional regulator